MSTILSYKDVVIRKDHICFGCNRNILKGTSMQVINSVDMGKVCANYWCEVCQTYWNEYMEHGDEIGIGDLRYNDLDNWEKIQQKVEYKNDNK